MQDQTSAQRRIAIIGSGFSGLCLAIELKAAGIDDFTIYEKDDRVGGTWRDNTYPGAACDLPSFAYCFSFEQKTDWSRKWSPQPEIQDYLEHCARKYGLLPHLRFRTEIASATFDDDAARWRLETTSGEQIEAEVLICAVGQLNRPSLPDIPGLATFTGERFHSARWNHAYALEGKRVAVVGNAASAIQFIPEIAPRVARLTVLQRSANWLLPRNDRAYSEREKWLFRNVPGLAKLYRWWIWLTYELRFPAFLGNRFIAKQTRKLAEQYIHQVVADPSMRAALVPDYPVGGKRILISDDYYQALVRPNVELVTSGIDHVEPDGIVTRDGVKHACDAIVLATGFESTRFLAPMRITGRGGRKLDDDWRDGARAYRGITVSGYPNLFLTYGPNTNLGHNSIVFMIECQAGYIVQAIRMLIERDLASLDVKPDVQQAFDAQTQRELSRTVWARTPHSWYKTASGRITNNWSGTTTRYWWGTRHFDAECYEAVPRAALAARAERTRADAA
ncbi:NAD(P)/FAD-dependent oxidoreductase [Candidatus Binatia bacterium]|nr:NAD(P)/FAD-dependent oxidoreductase [Candidatus Binatia bacterium]